MRERESGLNLDRNQSLFLLLGILLISGLSFFLGYMINSGGEDKKPPVNPGAAKSGKMGSGGSLYSEGEGSLPSALASSGLTSPDKKAGLVKESELTFFKSLSRVQSEAPKRVSGKKESAPKDKPESVRKRITEVKRPSPAGKADKKKSASTEILKMYTVQVASFKDKKDAFALKDRLERKGYDSYIMIFSKNDTRWFRVRVGAVRTTGEADALIEKLKTRENMGAYIARYTR